MDCFCFFVGKKQHPPEQNKWCQTIKNKPKKINKQNFKDTFGNG